MRRDVFYFKLRGFYDWLNFTTDGKREKIQRLDHFKLEKQNVDIINQTGIQKEELPHG